MNPRILQRILRRERSLFANDMEVRQGQIRDTLEGSRMLVIGAAGSIGTAFVKEAARWGLRGLRLVDPAENNLVELVRDLRADNALLPDDFATSAIAMGTLEFDHFLAMQQPFDYIVNFAALKHVRAERDPFTLMRMIHVNVLALADLLKVLANRPVSRFFSVSSDKAVHPANLMGASKALMEQVMWHGSSSAVSARFANVAFSDGSLLYGFQRRLEKKQPLAAPLDVKRYFISHEEAGQLCLLACVTGHHREIFIPRLDPGEDLVTFAEIAVIFLEEMGYTPRLFDDDEQARRFAKGLDVNSREWPCRFSVSDTTGEKGEEVFVADDEQVNTDRFVKLGVIIRSKELDVKPIELFLEEMERLRARSWWEMQEIIDTIKRAVPGLSYTNLGRNLDSKM